MQIRERPQVWAALLLTAAVVGTLALLVWQATRDDASPFFVDGAGAQWITYPITPEPVRPAGELEATFTRHFVLDRVPAQARLALRIHRSGSVTLNGAAVPSATLDGSGWKRRREGDVASLLRTGDNTIEVHALARSGPPALWFLLEAGDLLIPSDERWTASLMGAEDVPARLASVPMADWSRKRESPAQLDAENPRPFAALRAHAVGVAGLFAVGGLLGLAVALAIRRRGLTALPDAWCLAAWLLVSVAWVGLFVHNAGLHGAWGFDAFSHLVYVKTVLQEGRLPLADEGWQMYQPPLYYLLAAGWLKLGGFNTIDAASIAWLRWLGVAAGILQAGFVLLALRELFPERPGLVLAAFVFGTSLPVCLYLYQLTTNEILVATLSCGSLWWTVRMLRSPESGIRDHAVLGLLLGLAMLSKFSALIPLVLCSCVLLAQRWLAAPRQLPRHLAMLGVTAATAFAVCGWHYLRVAVHFGGNPFVGNWDEVTGLAWWQDPGYHVLGDYTRFGRALERPIMSAEASVPDALYSTLWGDGLLSGVGNANTRTPWDLQRMAVGYALALGPCLALLLGVGIAFVDFVRRPRAERFLLIAVLGATVYALTNMTLRLPFYAQAKAFYGLSALVSLAFCFALGFDAAVLRRRAVAPLGVAWLAAWALLAYATFLGDPQRLPQDPMKADPTSEASRSIARYRAALARGDGDAAIGALEQALVQDPDDSALRQLLAEQLRQGGRPDEALAAVRAALRTSPAGQKLHLMAGELWLERGDPERAAFHFGAAARLLPEQATGHRDDALGRQVEALCAAGHWSDAIALLAALRDHEGLSPTLGRRYAEVLLRAPPGSADAPLALAVAEAAARRTRDADPSVLDTLAAAQAANGRPADAVRSQERALELWRQSGPAARVEEAERRLAAYRRAAGS